MALATRTRTLPLENTMHSTSIPHRYDPKQIKRRTRATLLWTSVVSFALVVCIFVIAILLFPRLFRILPDTIPYGESEKEIKWGLLEGFAGLAALSLSIGSIILTISASRRNEMQERLALSQSSFNIYKEMYEQLTDPNSTAARRWIIVNLEPFDDKKDVKDAWLARTKERLDHRPDGWTEPRPPGREHLKRVLNMMDFIGFVSENYWAIEGELVDWMNPVIAKIWERIALQVENEAERRGEPDYYQAARKLGKDCLDWRKRKGLTSTIIKDGT
jgi:hypothetical protein